MHRAGHSDRLLAELRPHVGDIDRQGDDYATAEMMLRTVQTGWAS